MIQFNLLPDLKREYIKAKRQKHITIVVSMLTAATSLFIFTMLFLTVHVFQQTHIKNLDKDIAANKKTLESTPDLNKVLTIQNQLSSLPGLHDKKPVTSRLFTYISQITPANVSIGNISLDFDNETMSLSGGADTLSTINKFVDTIKFTTYKVGGEDSSDKPFSKVVLSSFSRGEKDSTYNISLTFNPAIFESSNEVTLVVPKIISTRSETEKPDELFKALPEVKQQ